MPTISLRLSEEQHEELKAWAHDGHRSVQKEIIWRLFTVEGGQAPKTSPATGIPREAIRVREGQTGELPSGRVTNNALEDVLSRRFGS